MEDCVDESPRSEQAAASLAASGASAVLEGVNVLLVEDNKMTSKLVTVSPDSTIDECMELMTGKFIRHLPVVADNKLAGIISIGDVVRRIIEEQKSIIGHMEQYIAGS